jgi:hypothetical protein
MIDSSTAEKLEKLLKLALGTDKEGEAIAAVNAMKRIAGADFHEVAARVKGGNLSEAEMRKIYETGVKDGKDTAAAEANTKFTDIDELSSHVDMAQFCIDHDKGRLSSWERNFAEEMIHWRRPSEKQLVVLRRIYRKQRR